MTIHVFLPASLNRSLDFRAGSCVVERMDELALTVARRISDAKTGQNPSVDEPPEEHCPLENQSSAMNRIVRSMSHEIRKNDKDQQRIANPYAQQLSFDLNVPKQHMVRRNQKFLIFWEFWADGR